MPTLRKRVVDHLTAHGASLDDAELADALGVDRPTITETCRQLEADGLVVRNLAGGTRPVRVDVADASPPAAAPPARVTEPEVPALPADPQTVFLDHARRVLSARWGTSLQRRHGVLPGGDAHPFELVSGNGRIVGQVVWIPGFGHAGEIKSAAISEAVLIVGHVTNADRRFLVFGDEWDAVSRWLLRFRMLLDGVELWYLDGDHLERLA